MDCDKRRIHYFRPIVVLGVCLGIYRLSDYLAKNAQPFGGLVGSGKSVFDFRLVATWFQSLNTFNNNLYKDVWVL